MRKQSEEQLFKFVVQSQLVSFFTSSEEETKKYCVPGLLLL